MAKEVGGWVCMPKADLKKLKTKAASCSVSSVLKRKKKTVKRKTTAKRK
jgi:hypothetical protein